MARPINRRQFLRLTGVAAAAPLGLSEQPGVWLETWTGTRAPEGRPLRQSGPPVVVVGAGLAGLQAASLLVAAGIPVVVIEARNFAGGRVQTLRGHFADELEGEPGPIRIPAEHSRVRRIALERGLNFIPFASANGSPVAAAAGQAVPMPSGLRELERTLRLAPAERGLSANALLQRYTRDLPAGLSESQPAPQPWESWRDLDRVAWPDLLRSRGASAGAVTFMTLGGDSRDLSALYVLRQMALVQGGAELFKIDGGMDQLPRAMAASLGARIQYGTSVVRIRHDAKSATVTCQRAGREQRVTASRVVVAAPFSTVRAIDIAPLSAAKTRAIAELPYFPAARLLLQTRERYWHGAGLSGSARTDDPAEIWDSAYDAAGTRGLLGVTVGGELGRRLAKMDRASAIQAGVSLVERALPGVRRHFEKGAVYRWPLDPWSRGAFAVFAPGQMSTLAPSLAAPEGRLHFAGEHTSPWMGWMEGALESGERVAAEVQAG